MSSGTPPPYVLPPGPRNRVLRAAIILDVVAVVAPILAYTALALGLANNAFASVAPALPILLIGAALLAGPIALILGIIALRRSRVSGDRGGSIAAIVISAILTLLIVGGGLVSLRIPIG